MPQFTLILGGAASGKSRYAESLLHPTTGKKLYIATAQAFDSEMTEKIDQHKRQRGPGWETIEAPFDPGAAMASAQPSDAVLLDCATLWLSNVMLAEQDWEAQTDQLLSALKACAAPVVVVSNETGMGIVPEHKLGRAFRNAQGVVNQKLGAQADRVALVVAGLPMTLKGAF